ncbi:uncharacterized protein TNCV_2111221 [Trichonephila clavipes]|nr:uncharacterized protein TNCV_2111221 [Trichonephila clavipes]
MTLSSEVSVADLKRLSLSTRSVFNVNKTGIYDGTKEKLFTSLRSRLLGLLKLVKRFEETGKLEDRAQAGPPCLKEARAPCIAVEMEAIASEAASGTSSAREAARRLGLPPSSVRNILHRILQLYPYKL